MSVLGKTREYEDSVRAENSRRLIAWCFVVLGLWSAIQLLTNWIVPDRPALSRWDFLFGFFMTGTLLTTHGRTRWRLRWQRMADDETAHAFRYRSITAGLWATSLTCAGIALFHPMTSLCAATTVMDASAAAGLLTSAFLELRSEKQT